MRTRRSNKAKRFNYSEAYELGSQESGEEREEVQDADADVDFEEPKGDKEGQEGSGDDGDEDDDEAIDDVRAEEEEEDEDEGLSEDAKMEDLGPRGNEADPTSSEQDEGDSTAAKLRKPPTGRSKWMRKLLKRGTVHAVPPYPSDAPQTRAYSGPLKPWTPAQSLLNILYGPDPGHIKVIRAMLRKWFDSQTLPNVLNVEGGVIHSPWLAEDYEEKEKWWSKSWYEKYRAASPGLQNSRKIRSEHIDMFKPPSHEMICFTGPFNQQQQVRTRYGCGMSIAQSGEPLDNGDTRSSASEPPKGWLLDTGGIPLSICWAPLPGHREQFLAVCTVPYADQELKEYDAPESDVEEKKRGSVQIWSVPCHRQDANPARLMTSLQFDFGRSKRIQWCPVAPPDDHTLGMLAVLCGDGQVRIIEVLRTSTMQQNYEWITSPVATLGFTDEYMVQATCLAWINTNRVCLGHSDGSISLWSVYPQRILMRRPIHNSHILDIASGFPSHPYHIATSPVSGSPTLTDLNLPSAETTSIPLPNLLNFQPNLLDWNDHLQGYFNIYPSPSPLNNIVGWTHVRYFVESRVLMTTPSPPMCIASGRTHPFTLVGCADGSLWAMNPLRVLIRDKADEVHKLKILQHEFCPTRKIHNPNIAAPPGEPILRGAVRILQGFKPEMNRNPIAELARAAENKPRSKKRKKPSKGGGNSRRSSNMAAVAALVEVEESSEDDAKKKAEFQALAKKLDHSKIAVHEARTRITFAAWNPNIEYGWWAAAAMGSGLVKVMDLGIDG